MKRLILFVEGRGDVNAVPILVKKIVTEGGGWESMFLDPNPFRIRGVENLVLNANETWLKLLRAALKRPKVAGIVVVLDGDARRWEGRPFCAGQVACTLVERAKAVGAGRLFSLGFVFACCEFETWLLAGVESLAGKRLSDGRPGVAAGTQIFEGELEVAPRNAKGELGRLMNTGYKATLDQAELTTLLDLGVVRQRGLRSFVRLERAVKQLTDAGRTGEHIATPPSTLKESQAQ